MLICNSGLCWRVSDCSLCQVHVFGVWLQPRARVTQTQHAITHVLMDISELPIT
jgi:hypothetical protein